MSFSALWRDGLAPRHPKAHAVQIPDRFYLLDALRGLAALGVVLFHWQNFLVAGDVEKSGYLGQEQPWFDLLRMVYERGHLAVDLFFSLSGFVFFCLYSDRVAQRQVSGSEFFWLRFSRLFPLHLATLLLAAGGQALLLRTQGHPLAYSHNDLYHFALHLPLLSSVGLEDGMGFNAPIWSVSVEVALYIAFFALCRAGLARTWVLLVLSLLGFIVLSSIYQPLGRGLASFFLGGLVFATYQYIGASVRRRRWAVAIVGLTAAMWVATIVLYYFVQLDKTPLLWRLNQRFATALLFPLTILALALIDTRRPGIGKALAPLGDISYSSYLLHFPLQLAFALVVATLGLSWDVFKSSSTVVMFMVVLLLLSRASYRHFEMPTQRALRQIWRKAAAARLTAEQAVGPKI